MEYPNLRAALDSSVNTLQTLLKQLVPIDTGSLRDSITLRSSIENGQLILNINLNYYWKYICAGSRLNKEPVPVDEILTLSPTIIVQRYESLNNAIEAIIKALNEALEKDIINEINNIK